MFDSGANFTASRKAGRKSLAGFDKLTGWMHIGLATPTSSSHDRPCAFRSRNLQAETLLPVSFALPMSNCRLPFSNRACNSLLVTRFRTLLVVLLALLWAPVTSHCLLERLPGLDFLSCCPHDPGQCEDKEKDCETDSCAVIEQGLYKLQEHSDLIPKPQTAAAAFLLDFVFSPMRIDSREESVQPMPPSPPLSSAWQFIYRAAVPVRAPSLLA